MSFSSIALCNVVLHTLHKCGNKNEESILNDRLTTLLNIIVFKGTTLVFNFCLLLLMWEGIDNL